MRNIQEVGKEILLNAPAKLYIFVGSEYGIKCKYMQQLQEYYQGRKVESTSVSEVLSMMKKKRIIPLQPSLYVVRYDEPFISSLNDKVAKEIDSINICGTLVCLYEGAKFNSRLDKYLGKYTVSIDAVGDNFVEKYLHSDFPGLADRLVRIAINSSSNYGHARNICRAMKAANEKDLMRLKDEDLYRLFNFRREGTEAQIRLGVAARNFEYLMEVLDGIDDHDGVVYMCIQTMVDIDKAMDAGYAPAELKPYMGSWSRSDVYTCMCNAYDTLKLGRSISSKLEENVVLLFSSICQNPIPRMRWQ